MGQPLGETVHCEMMPPVRELAPMRLRQLGQNLLVTLSIVLSRASSAAAQRRSADSVALEARASQWAMAHSGFQYVARHTSPNELRQLRVDFDSLLRADTTNYIAMRLFRMDSTSRVRRLNDADFAAALMTFAFGINPSFRQLATIVDIDVAGSVRRGPAGSPSLPEI